MIVRIEKELFNSPDPEILSSLAGIVRTALTKKFFWDIETVPNTDELKSTIWFNDYLSKTEQDKIIGEIELINQLSNYNTAEHRFYLSTIIIGLEKGQLSPLIAEKLLNSNSKILIENEDNDWNFIKAIIQKYKNGSTNKTKRKPNRKQIYSLINQYLENKWIEPIHAGGGGEFEKRIEKVFEFEGSEFACKLMTVFDSDKTSLNDTLKQETINRIKYLKNIPNEIECNNFEYNAETDLIIWHVLYKREMENYLPLQIVEKYALDSSISDYYKKSDIDLDFIDLENSLPISDNAKRYFKRKFPKLFLHEECTKQLLNDKCKHHSVQIEVTNNNLEEVTEIEHILIKIAKII